MRDASFQALQAPLRKAPPGADTPAVVLAGATGALGSEMLRRLAGSGRHGIVQVLAREPITEGLRGVACVIVPPEFDGAWPHLRARTGVILFEPPRLFYDRERPLWTPRPDQLQPLAGWMRACGVATLIVVLPHAQGRLPDAVKRGLASLDEQAVAALGFQRVLFVRSAQKPKATAAKGLFARTAHWMLSTLNYMVPGSEQLVRASKVAEFVSMALQLAPPGIHVADPELVWRASRGNLQALVAEWVGR